MFDDNDEDDQTKEPRTRGNRPNERQTMAATGGGAQQRMMPWDRQGGGQGGQPWGGGRPQMPWQGASQGQPGPQMPWGGQGGQMPDWHALAQQFAQRFAQNNPFLQRMGMTGQGQVPPGQAPAAPPQGMPQGQPQPGAAPQFSPQIQRLAQLFGRQQPGGIVGPGQGPQGY